MTEPPDVGSLSTLCPEISKADIEEFRRRLPQNYFENTTASAMAEDLRGLTQVTEPGICVLRQSRIEGGMVTCTVYGHDAPALFSVITGLLSATGFDIVDGAIYTYARESVQSISRAYRGRRPREYLLTRESPRKIIDRFTGSIAPATSFSAWQAEFETKLQQVYSLLHAGDEESGVAGARRVVYEEVSRALTARTIDQELMLYPMEMSVAAAEGGGARVSIVAEDTPFFLFALSNALSLQGVSIDGVRIRTRGTRVEDEMEVGGASGEALDSADRLNRIKLSVLVTKQFTYFLHGAPDPQAALQRFESLAGDLIAGASGEAVHNLMTNPEALQDLARILGASDFLWEDFIRLQYENILPLLEPASREKLLSHSPDELETLLNREVTEAESWTEKHRVLNEFKNREIYLIDLDHIVSNEADFLFLSRRLTALAEVVVQSATELAMAELTERYGKPRSFADMEARYAIMGLGKLGGAALGYASDIELLFIYSDNGHTDGETEIGNNEFFERCFKYATQIVEAKQEGIFHIDLRLRPHGKAGPVACSLESFCEYYGAQGRAHSYEKLALVRMRAIGGDPDLGARVERLRDEMVYSTDSIDLKDLRDLREKQLAEKTEGNRLNAKFSPGALADLEYSVQIIQCRFGKDNPRLRTPRIHVALDELVNAGLMSGDEAGTMVEAYHFLRRLINGLRMLRGSARDLFLPNAGSDEYVHLARRTGYVHQGGLSPAQRLHVEFETRTAFVRRFIESRLGRSSIPGPPVGNAADLVLSDSLPQELRERILTEGGFRIPDRSYANLKSIIGNEEERRLFAHLAVLAWDYLVESPDPDMALNNWERFITSLDERSAHFSSLLAQPLRLELLLKVFAGSQFLADTLARSPDFLDWVAQPRTINRVRGKDEMLEELRGLSRSHQSNSEWRSELRRFRKREVLRTGTRDICLGAPLDDVVEELSNLAESVLEATLERIWREVVGEPGIAEVGFCILAFGKLGGRELNYSSDIDLLALYAADSTALGGLGESPEMILSRVMELLRASLSDYTEDGYVYRVDFRLRPYGRSGNLVHSDTSIRSYYESAASLWEHQAFLKLRPVAGHVEGGRLFVEETREQAPKTWNPDEVGATVRRLRDQASGGHSSIPRGVDVKSGTGGIRDIEFLIQAIQLVHGGGHPEILLTGSMEALEQISRAELLPGEICETLGSDYRYLRRVEHFLQLLEDRQVHAIPTTKEDQLALARRIEGNSATAEQFMAKVDETMAGLRRIYDEYLPGGSKGKSEAPNPPVDRLTGPASDAN